jgi:hypothetical protein
LAVTYWVQLLHSLNFAGQVAVTVRVEGSVVLSVEFLVLDKDHASAAHVVVDEIDAEGVFCSVVVRIGDEQPLTESAERSP